jgi:hypothetical protein
MDANYDEDINLVFSIMQLVYPEEAIESEELKDYNLDLAQAVVASSIFSNAFAKLLRSDLPASKISRDAILQYINAPINLPSNDPDYEEEAKLKEEWTQLYLRWLEQNDLQI